MNLQGDASLGLDYSNRAQIARVISESWCERELFCLMCNSERLERTPHNTPARDLECDSCGGSYQLKSSARPFGRRVVDGAYSVMMKTLEGPNPPHLLLLQYGPEFDILNLTAIPAFSIGIQSIEPRKPLSDTARRAGWTGCNILLDQVPKDAMVHIVQNGLPKNASAVRRTFASLKPLADQSLLERSWALELLKIVDALPKEFSLAQVYAYQESLEQIFPNNQHVRDKLRQQLQVLRDIGKLQFLGRGHYQKRSIA